MKSDQSRFKIYSICDAYKREIAKINKSKKSGTGNDSLYKPKLKLHVVLASLNLQIFYHRVVRVYEMTILLCTSIQCFTSC